MKRTVITSFARTPFGKFGGSLKEVSAVDLGANAIKATVSRNLNTTADDVDLVIYGQVLAGGCGQIPARQAAIKAGIDPRVPVDQINKVCASSMRAVTLADQIIRSGDANVIVAGGMENMSAAPFFARGVRWGHRMFNTEFIDLMVNDGLWCPYYDCHMASHGGKVALEYGVTREQQDEWAFFSQQKAANAKKNGRFEREIAPVIIGEKNSFSEDESIRNDTSLDKLKALNPLFSPDNTVTAGNAPGVNDGASAITVMDEKFAEKKNESIEAIILGHAMSSENPRYIATAPGNAVVRLLSKMGMSPGDIDLYEINEAFAAVTLVSSKIIGCDLKKVNVNGGAIALGHPLGASGARIIMTLISELQRQNKQFGVAAICSGMGQGDAILIENARFHS